MFKINNVDDLIEACISLEKSAQIPQLPVEIVFDVENIYWEPKQFQQYLQNMSKITNDKFFIKIVVPSNNYQAIPEKLKEIISQLESISLLSKVKSMLFHSHKIAYCDYYLTNEILGKLNCLRDVEFEDTGYDGFDSSYRYLITLFNKLNDFSKKHTNIQSIVFTKCGEHLQKSIQKKDCQAVYLDLQNTLKKNAATLDKLEDFIEKIKELQKSIEIYKKRLLKTNTTKTVIDNDKRNCEEISKQLEKAKQQFKETSEILTIKNNLYGYYYLAKHQVECEENDNYKQIFEYLNKITPPLDSDPEKDKHATLYYKAKMWQASMCLDKSQYAQIKSIDLKSLDKREIEAERIKLVIKYALEAKQESDNLAESVLQEYILGTFVSSTENEFAGINSKDKNTFDVIWQLVEAFKKYVENNKKDTKEQETQTENNSLLIFRGRSSTQQARGTTELEETNSRKRPRSRSSSCPL